MKALHAKILASDGVVIAAPEYNFSITSALKNILDWISRVQPNPLEKKPVAIFSVTGGPSGGARSQHDLRKVLVFFNAFVMIKPEVFMALTT